jgi:hypothetical protein
MMDLPRSKRFFGKDQLGGTLTRRGVKVVFFMSER